jgi:hypothetical protein
MLAEGWYLMNTSELEQELLRFRDPENDHPASGAVPLSIEDALAFKRSGNRPDSRGRWLRLVLHVTDAAALDHLNERRLLFEPDLHEAPDWRRPGSKPVNVVPLRTPDVRTSDTGAWWDDPEIAQLEEEWRSSGTVSGLRVPGEYRGFIFKTVLALRAASEPVTAEKIANSIERWLPSEDAALVRRALGGGS